MSVTLEVSSDIVGGVVALVLVAVGYLISAFAYPTLMAKSQAKAVWGGKKVEVSSRSMNSVRNFLGFWVLSSTMLVNLISLVLEFGLLGFSMPVTSELSAVILGGGPRFTDNYTTGGDLFMNDLKALPQLFTSATGSCLSYEEYQDFRMLKNFYPAFGVNASESSTNTFRDFECTSSWLGSAEWTTEPAGNLTIEAASLVEQVAYTETVDFSYNLRGSSTEFLTISYGLGTSFRDGLLSPVVLVNGTSHHFAISITLEQGHYVYSMSTQLETYDNGDVEMLTGLFDLGHLRCSEFSLGGAVAFALVAERSGSLAEVYEYSSIWWLSESRPDSEFSTLVYNNDEGAEQSWPSLTDDMGNVYREYQKQTEPVLYPFEVGEIEATLMGGWFIVLSSALGVIVCALSLSSVMTKKSGCAFWSYDDLCLMAGKSGQRAVFGVVAGEGQKYIGFVRNDVEI